LANVSLNDVRDAINLSSADVPDEKLQKMVKRAEVTLELELGKEIDYSARAFEQIQNSEAQLSMDKERRAVAEIRQDLHREIRRHAILNEVRIYELTNAIIEEIIGNEESVKALIKRLKQVK
jgi:hypothetical protein